MILILSILTCLVSTKAQDTPSDNPYCDICCMHIELQTIGKNCGSHTMCKYPENKIGPACKGYVNVRFTESEKDTLVKIHNNYRNQVALGQITLGLPGPQPPATNMRTMEWNGELEMVAERWAAQCVFDNDICRDLARFPVGQNAARGVFATVTENKLIRKWFQEVTRFNSREVKSYNIGSNGSHHYTQLVWADTYLLGCARAVFQSSSSSNVSYNEHLVCNYGPTGNIPSQPVYRVGTPCTECHEGTSCSTEYKGLCKTDMSDEFKVFLARNSCKKYCCNANLLLLVYFPLHFTWKLIVSLVLCIYKQERN